MGGALAFRKYQGLGNDFIVIEARDSLSLSSERVAALCDRRFGIGADGVLLKLPAREGENDTRMRVINADGSVPEMCGNGVRCLALDVLRTRGDPRGAVRIETDAGLRTCEAEDGPVDVKIAVDMGIVRVLGDHSLSLDGETLAMMLADAGNPHAILLGTFSRAEVERAGPRVATHPDFPRGTNVEFARVTANGIDLVVWERGVGITLACGTGACATVAVACARGLAKWGESVLVHLPGGDLVVTVLGDGRTTMRGPARFVFSGTAEF